MAEHGAEESGDVWEILGSKYVVKDRWLTLRADDCRNADGQVIAPYYVLEYPPWVNVLALTPEHNVVLIKQYRHGIRQVILELPGGALDEQDASILDAAQRELREKQGTWRRNGVRPEPSVRALTITRTRAIAFLPLVLDTSRSPNARFLSRSTSCSCRWMNF